MSLFWTKEHDFWDPLWHSFFIVFVNDLKSRKVLSKMIDFPIVFSLNFIFFQKRIPGPFWECASAECLWNSVLWCHFRFSGFSKETFVGHAFRTAGYQKPNMSNSCWWPGVDSIFPETIIITVPFTPSVCKKSIFGKDGLFVCFFLIFFVLCSDNCYYSCW